MLLSCLIVNWLRHLILFVINSEFDILIWMAGFVSRFRLPNTFLRRLSNQQNRYERSLNFVQLIGRVGCDPRTAGQNAGNQAILFSLATNEYYGTNRSTADDLDDPDTASNPSSPRQRVDWHRVSVFRPHIKQQVEQHLRQGDRVYIKGRIHYDLLSGNNAEKSESRYVTSIIADDLIFLGRPKSADS
ncbi:hypothetical protein ACOME3_004789 [Neoechinorhynchus agilis]